LQRYDHCFSRAYAMTHLTRSAIAALSACTLMSCSTFFQSSVRTSGTACSTSLLPAFVDVALAGTAVYAMSQTNSSDGQNAMIGTAGVFAASAAYGLWKRHRCGNFKYEHRNDVVVVAAPQEQATDQPQDQPQDQQDQTGDGTVADNNAPACAEGSQLGGPFGNECLTCPVGATLGGMSNNECYCPQGTQSNGAQCVDVQTGAVAPPVQQQRTVNVNVSVHQRTEQHTQTVTVHRVGPNQPFCAMFQVRANAPMTSKHEFNGAADQSMSSCSSFCTGKLSQRLNCQCVQGGC
jgi:hypothetical protein